MTTSEGPISSMPATRVPRPRNQRVFLSILPALILAAGISAQIDRPASLRFRVSVDPALGSDPVAGRLIILMTNSREAKTVVEPAFADPSESTWLTAREVRALTPGQSVDLDADDVAAPEPVSHAPPGNYQVMALLDVDHNAAFATVTAADIRSKVVTIARNGRADDVVTLTLTERGSEPPIQLPGGGRAIDFISPSLSVFWGRPIHMRAFVILPLGYAKSQSRYPVAYITQGFTGYVAGFIDYFGKPIAAGMANGLMPPMIWVLLDESFTSGTHEFVDSVNNGPWGRALTTELIPYLEREFRMDARPSGRLLNGHSSGGWATLWLQLTYPSFFGGTWSTSPDPVDFQDFLGVNLSVDANFYRDPEGSARPFARVGDRQRLTLEQSAKEEVVLGEYGGQFSSFEWVFSPRAADGRAMPLFDRTTGDISRDVAQYWREHYDISRLLTERARRLVKPLRGKIHVIVGTADHFYLDRTVRRLQQAIAPFDYQATFTYLKDRNHFDLYEPDLLARIAAEMYAAARPDATWRPASALVPRTDLTK